jgi:hypothetical protein
MFSSMAKTLWPSNSTAAHTQEYAKILGPCSTWSNLSPLPHKIFKSKHFIEVIGFVLSLSLSGCTGTSVDLKYISFKWRLILLDVVVLIISVDTIFIRLMMSVLAVFAMICEFCVLVTVLTLIFLELDCIILGNSLFRFIHSMSLVFQ